MSASVPDGHVEAFLVHAVAGEQQPALRLVLDLLDDGVPVATVIEDLLRPVQREVGQRWQRADWATADEHLVTGVTQAAVEALATTVSVATQGMVVVVCAEGDWHSLPAQMFAESLRARGQGVTYLGASVPVDDVAAFLARRRPDALAVTCNLPLAYLGAARLADVAHRHGIPVIAGGRALTPHRARHLGADAWAPDVDAAADVLRTWREHPPTLVSHPVRLDPRALELQSRAEQLSDEAFEKLRELFPAMSDYDERQRARTREDLAYIVRFLAAARLVDDDEVFTTFHRWLEQVLAARGVPAVALDAGLRALAPLLRDIDEGAHRLVAAARPPGASPSA